MQVASIPAFQQAMIFCYPAFRPDVYWYHGLDICKFSNIRAGRFFVLCHSTGLAAFTRRVCCSLIAHISKESGQNVKFCYLSIPLDVFFQLIPVDQNVLRYLRSADAIMESNVFT